MSDVIRPLVEADARELLALRIANRGFLTPFDPARPDAFFALEAQRETARNDDGSQFAILDGDAIVGMVSLSNISFGPFRSANVGY